MVGWNQIHQTLPFSIRLDQEGRVLSVGRSLRFAEHSLVGALLFDRMTLRRHSFDSVADIRSRLERGVIADLAPCDYLLMGAFHEMGDGFCFVGTPRLDDMEALNRTGLTFGDFAPHDGIVSYLFSLQNLAVVRKEESDAIQRSRLMQSRMLDAANKATDFVLAINGAGLITYANPPAAERFGLPFASGDVSLLSILDERSQEKVRRGSRGFDWSVFNEGTTLSLDTEWGKVGVSGIFFEMGLSDLGSDWVALLRDVREVDRAHRERVHAERATRMQAMARLSGEVAHEFNNILAVIISSVDFMLGSGKLDELGLVEDADLILSGASRGALLAGKLLEVSSRPRSLARKLVLAEAVQGMLPVMENAARGCEIDLRQDEADVPVSIEPRRLEQIVINLVSNAADALGRQGVIRVKVLGEPSERRCRLIVEDDGVGMSQEVVERMFDPLFSTKAGAGGVGIGLSTVFANVHEVGGSIDVESQPGTGTRVEVTLPRSGAADGDSGRERRVSEGASARPIRGRSVVVVEDNEGLRGAMVRVLTGQGAVVSDFPDSASARRSMAARSSPPDLLITDVLLGEENGLDYAREAWRDGAVGAVLVITGHADMDDLHQVLDRYGWELLMKPFRNGDLVDSVSVALGRAEA